MKKWTALIAVLLLSSTVAAQELFLSYIIVREGALIYVGSEREITVRETMDSVSLIGWNPSGRYFMNILRNFDDGTGARDVILLNDLTVPESFPLMTDIPFYSSNLFYFGDNTLLFTEYSDVLIVSEDEQGLGVIQMNLYQWDFNESQSSVTEIGGIPYGVGCGGGSFPNALDRAYNEEAHGDTYGQYNQKILTPTPYGIVHSNSCTAIRTLLTQPETLDSVELGDNLRWSEVSPDRQFVIGTSGSNFTLINLETLEETVIFTADAPIYSSIFSRDSQHIYFVARTTDGDRLDIDGLDAYLENYDMYSFDPAPEDALLWQSTLYDYDISTGELTELYSAEAYALANLTVVGDSLYFSQIETPQAWLQAFVDDPDTADSALIERSYYLLSFADNTLTQLEDNLAGAFIQPQ